jgi:hypothetical protein
VNFQSLVSAVASSVLSRASLDPATAATLAEGAVKFALDQFVQRFGGLAEDYVLSHATQIHAVASDAVLHFVGRVAEHVAAQPATPDSSILSDTAQAHPLLPAPPGF